MCHSQLLMNISKKPKIIGARAPMIVDYNRVYIDYI